MSVGENGVGRVVQRTAELMQEGTDPRAVGAIPLDIIQRYINEWSSASHDLFGGEDSSNAAEAFATGLKGRYREGDGIYKDPRALEQFWEAPALEGGRLTTVRIPLRRAMNALLLEAYHADCQRIVARWNRTLGDHGVSAKLTLPSLRFNRQIGLYGGQPLDYEGSPIEPARVADERARHLPTAADYDYVRSVMIPVRERGRFANWIAPPHQGINNQPIDFEYVQFH